MLDGEAIGPGQVVRGPIGVAEVRREVRALPGSGGVLAEAVDPVDRVALEVVDAHSAALVRVGHRASVLESPLPGGGDRAVHAPGSRRGRRHDAGIVPIEARGDLHHQGRVDAPAPVVVVGEPLFTGDHALRRRRVPAGVDVRTVQRAVTSGDGDVHQRAVVRVDRPGPQLGRGRWIRQGRRPGRRDQPGCAQPAGEQIVAAAVVRGGGDRGWHDERRQLVHVRSGVAGRDQQAEREEALRQVDLRNRCLHRRKRRNGGQCKQT